MDARVTPTPVPIAPFADEPLRCAVDQDTALAPAKEQFDLYRSWNEALADVTQLQAAGPSFPARQRAWQLGDLALIDVVHPGSGYAIQWKHRDRPLLDNWVLTIPLSRDGATRTGKPKLKCLGRPYVSSCDTEMFVVVSLPHCLAAADPSRIELSDSALRFLADYVLLLHRSVPDLTEGDIPHIVSATTSLFAAALTPSDHHLLSAQGPVAAAATTRISHLIAERLADPDLTPDKISRAAGVSRSRLYRIFQPAGGVSNYVRRKRLLKTRDALADRSDRRTISSIAEEWGFVSASTYSRMFKSEFGMSPKEARELGWQGVKHSSWLNVDQPLEDVGGLCNLLINNSLGLSLSSKR